MVAYGTSVSLAMARIDISGFCARSSLTCRPDHYPLACVFVPLFPNPRIERGDPILSWAFWENSRCMGGIFPLCAAKTYRQSNLFCNTVSQPLNH